MSPTLNVDTCRTTCDKCRDRRHLIFVCGLESIFYPMMVMTEAVAACSQNENAATSAAVSGMNGDDGESLACVQYLILRTPQTCGEKRRQWWLKLESANWKSPAYPLDCVHRSASDWCTRISVHLNHADHLSGKTDARRVIRLRASGSTHPSLVGTTHRQ